jgi:nucleoside recognition membrane protein YjiH
MDYQPKALVETENITNQKKQIFNRLRRIVIAVTRYEIWILAPLVVGTMLSARLLPVPVGIAFLFWLLRWIGTGKLTIRDTC